MKTYIIASIATALISLATASTAQIYKWVDEDGQIHYTERPAPAGKHSEVIEDKIRLAADLTRKHTSRSSYLPPSREKKDAAEESPETRQREIASEQKEAQDNYREQLEAYCDSQQKNLKLLKSNSPIAWEENGKTELLSSEQKKKKLQEISISVEKNCAKNQPKMKKNKGSE